jgi:cytochrome c-type biogenesis protein CcmH/NrfG
MLFEKIRRTQKPVFIFLGSVFALSFVFLGVGSGVGGISLGDLLGTSSSSSSSISSLNDKVRKNPKDAASWLALADAYQADQQTDPALGAYQQYIGLRPKDVDTITLAAGLYQSRAQQLYQQAAYWNSLASQYQAANTLLPSSAGKLQSAFPSPVVSSIQSPLQTKASTYQQQEQGDITAAIDLWKKAIALSPSDSSFRRALYQDALAIQDYKTAYAAVNAVLRLEPDAPDKKQLEDLAKQLKPLSQINPQSSPVATAP